MGMRSLLGVAIAVAVSATGGGGALAQGNGAKDFARSGDAPLFARGCYWYRGVRRCSQYCYIEIDGVRYCQDREFNAVPQGDPYAIERPSVDQLYRAGRHP